MKNCYSLVAALATTLSVATGTGEVSSEAGFQIPPCTIHMVVEDPYEPEEDKRHTEEDVHVHDKGRQWVSCTNENGLNIEFKTPMAEFYEQEIWDGDIVQMDVTSVVAAGVSLEETDPDEVAEELAELSLHRLKKLGKDSDGKGIDGKEPDGKGKGVEETHGKGKAGKDGKGGKKRARRNSFSMDAFNSSLTNGDRITVNTIPPMVKISDARSQSRARRVQKRQFAEAVAEHGPRSVLLIRVQYETSSGEKYYPDHCDHDCLTTNMWNGDQNVNDLYQEISSGLVSFPRHLGKIIDVTVKNGQHSKTSCKFWEMGLEADEAVRDSLNFEPGDYDHRVYILPQKLGGCTFGGLGYVGCSPLYCKTWIRQPAGGTLGHELGHNLGVWHSSMDYTNDGVQENEYGDNSDLMGSTTNWRGFNAPHRVVMNWIPNQIEHMKSFQDWMLNCEAEQYMSLYSISEPLQGSQKVILKVPRKAPGGGNYFVSFRTSGGYDNKLASIWKNKVYVHYHTTHSTRFQTNTQLVQRLGPGETFTDPNSPFKIEVKSMSSNYATITYQFCKNGEQPASPTPPPTTPSPTQEEEKVCGDSNAEKCRVWKLDGYCESGNMYFPYMNTHCQETCGMCNVARLSTKDGYEIMEEPSDQVSRVTQCMTLEDGRGKPLCGASSPTNSKCCEHEGLRCMAIKKKAGGQVHKCVYLFRRKDPKLKLKSTCTKSLQCASTRCDKMGTWKCIRKNALNRARRGKLVTRALGEDEEDEEDETTPFYEGPLDSNTSVSISLPATVLFASLIVVVAGFSLLAVRVRSRNDAVAQPTSDPSTDLLEIPMQELEVPIFKSEMEIKSTMALKDTTDTSKAVDMQPSSSI